MNLIRLLLIALMLCVGARIHADSLTMNDLAALADQGQWSELLEKARAVAPAERTQSWSELVSDAAIKSLQMPVVSADPLKVVSWSESLMHWYPHLASDNEFMQLRAKQSWNAFEACFAERSWASECNQALRRFVAADANNAELALRAATLVSRSFSSKHVAMPYFHAALKRSGEAGSCTSDNFKLAALSALALEPPAEEVAHASEVVFGSCWPFADDDFVKELTNTDARLKNTCSQLLKRNVLVGARLAKCRRLAEKST